VERSVTSTRDDRSAVADVLPLSPLQEGLLFLARWAAGEDGAEGSTGVDPYTIQLQLDGHGPRPERLRDALDAVLARHDVLRAAIRDRKRGGPVAVVPEAASTPWTETDAADDAEVEQACEAERVRPFALGRPPLVRALLIRRPDGRWRLAITLHHLVVDGWSLGLLVTELLDHAEGREPAGEAVPYRRYLEWLGEQDTAAMAQRFADDLAGLDEPTRLAPAPTGDEGAPADLPATVETALDRDLGDGLAALARARGVTTATVLSVVWGVVLARLTGRDDVVFGTTVSGRPPEVPGVEAILGLFVNTVPVRVRLRPGRRSGAELDPRGSETVGELLDRSRTSRPRAGPTTRPGSPRSSGGRGSASCSTRCSWSRTSASTRPRWPASRPTSASTTSASATPPTTRSASSRCPPTATSRRGCASSTAPSGSATPTPAPCSPVSSACCARWSPTRTAPWTTSTSSTTPSATTSSSSSPTPAPRWRRAPGRRCSTPPSTPPAPTRPRWCTASSV
jgi:hypothetical protein